MHPTEIDIAAFAAARADGAPVLDVRDPAEYVEGHVPGARLVPLAKLSGELPELRPSDRVYVICESGSRSAVAVERLRRAGIDAVAVRGGTAAWRSAALPVVRGTRAAA